MSLGRLFVACNVGACVTSSPLCGLPRVYFPSKVKLPAPRLPETGKHQQCRREFEAVEHAISTVSHFKEAHATLSPRKGANSKPGSGEKVEYLIPLCFGTFCILPQQPSLTSKFFLTSAFPSDATAGVEVAVGTMMSAARVPECPIPSCDLPKK